MHRLVNDWEVTRNWPSFQFPILGARGRVDLSTRRAGQRQRISLAITGREDEHEILVGIVGVRVDARTCGRLGYWVGRRFWGHGVATEAAGRLARWALANLDLDRLRPSRNR